MSERGLETVNIFNDIISLVIKSIEKDGGKDTQADPGADAARVAAEQERSRRQAAEAEAARLQAEKDAVEEEARHLDQWGGPGHP